MKVTKMKINLVLFLKIAIAIASIIAADRIVKTFAQGCNFLFCIKRSINYGAAFGLFPAMTALFIVVAIIMILLMIFFLYNTKSTLLQVALTLIIGGTTANLIDRIVYGYVIDVISLNFIFFPSFNIADIANITGALLLFIFLLKPRKKLQAR